MAKQTRQTHTNKPAAGEKQAFTVTDRAPGRVNGQRVEKGQTLTLTEDEARTELLAGHIVPAPASKAD